MTCALQHYRTVFYLGIMLVACDIVLFTQSLFIGSVVFLDSGVTTFRASALVFVACIIYKTAN